MAVWTICSALPSSWLSRACPFDERQGEEETEGKAKNSEIQRIETESEEMWSKLGGGQRTKGTYGEPTGVDCSLQGDESMKRLRQFLVGMVYTGGESGPHRRRNGEKDREKDMKSRKTDGTKSMEWISSLDQIQRWEGERAI